MNLWAHVLDWLIMRLKDLRLKRRERMSRATKQHRPSKSKSNSEGVQQQQQQQHHQTKEYMNRKVDGTVVWLAKNGVYELAFIESSKPGDTAHFLTDMIKEGHLMNYGLVDQVIGLLKTTSKKR